MTPLVRLRMKRMKVAVRRTEGREASVEGNASNSQGSFFPPILPSSANTTSN